MPIPLKASSICVPLSHFMAALASWSQPSPTPTPKGNEERKSHSRTGEITTVSVNSQVDEESESSQGESRDNGSDIAQPARDYLYLAAPVLTKIASLTTAYH
ncbi:hypothetical protein AVEN_54813-1 [Araneus ventricosus]|uniref:Uncharacterized protein n=1 Tax=Araneus ventricosus TaxID=182803 RepID=A0A4Y2EWP0_ARAVE|nr:hypothetical protein AVEN_54813-1 [Araneus ventricosus]